MTKATNHKPAPEARHVAPGDIAAYVDGRHDLTREEEMRLLRHLATDCDSCWSCVEALPPSSPHLAEDSLRRALCRVRQPLSWLLLDSQHLKMARAPRATALGFAQLVGHEAHGISLKAESLEPMALVWGLVEDLLGEEPESEVANDLAATIQCLFVLVHVLRQDTEQAAMAVTAADRYRRLGSGSDDVRVTVLEGQALVAYLTTSDSGAGADLVREGLSVIGASDPIRRFEIVTEDLKREALFTVGLRSKREALAQLRSDTLKALRELKGLSEVDDPIYRLNGLIHKLSFASNMAFTANTCYDANLGHKILPASRISREVEAALEAIREQADVYSLGRVYDWMGQLQVASGLPRAMSWFHKALECHAEMNCVGSYASTIESLLINHGSRDKENAFLEEVAERAARIFSGEDLESVQGTIRETRARKKDREYDFHTF